MTSAAPETLLPCPCCGSLSVDEPGQYEVCAICGWEDDPVQSADPSYGGGANAESLQAARASWKRKSKRMRPTGHKVCLVVDRKLGARIAALAESCHVWAVASPVNTPVIQTVWGAAAATPDDDPMGPGVTSFRADDLTESSESICMRLAEEIDIHHGEGMHDPPWTEIEVVGAALTEDLRAAFAAIGGAQFLSSREGFICRRVTERS